MERDEIEELAYDIAENFNSHAHVERDRISQNSSNVFFISTHTLTWSVTVFPKPNHYIINHFNSHAHVERDS